MLVQNLFGCLRWSDSNLDVHAAAVPVLYPTVMRKLAVAGADYIGVDAKAARELARKRLAAVAIRQPVAEWIAAPPPIILCRSIRTPMRERFQRSDTDTLLTFGNYHKVGCRISGNAVCSFP